MKKSQVNLEVGHLEFKKDLAQKILQSRTQLFEWTSRLCHGCLAPFYTSVDIRDSGYKIAPVDTNLFPAGFNNICPEDQRTAPAIIRTEIEVEMSRLGRPIPERILIIPESHTSNLFYLENIYTLRELLVQAGFETEIGWYGDLPAAAVDGKLTLKTASEKNVVAHTTTFEGGQAKAGEFVPDLILLNNDFSNGYPERFDALSQPVIPSHRLGWHTRKKSEHFRHYNRLAKEFAEIIGVDSWIFQVETEAVDDVDFNEEKGIEAVATTVERVIGNTREAYAKRGIKHAPFAFVKNNSGTYGMGIMVVHGAKELMELNRRTKNKMSVGKGKAQIRSVVVQEGIPTATLVDRLTSEPVIYLVGTALIGGFLRTHPEKGNEDNLNAQGMVFRKLCMSDLRDLDQEVADAGVETTSTESEIPFLEIVYGAVARLAAIATGYEIAEQENRIKKAEGALA